MNRGLPTPWLRYLLMALIVEKIVQHVVVTIALLFDWTQIRSTVVLDPDLLIILGAIVAMLFGICLWATVQRLRWASPLAAGLALFDIIGEFLAQGTIAIRVPVSFLVAIALLIVALKYRSSKP